MYIYRYMFIYMYIFMYMYIYITYPLHRHRSRRVPPASFRRPLSSELGTNKPVKATFGPWLEPFLVGSSSARHSPTVAS